MFQSGNHKEAEIHTIVAYELTWCAIYLDSKLEKDKTPCFALNTARQVRNNLLMTKYLASVLMLHYVTKVNLYSLAMLPFVFLQQVICVATSSHKSMNS